MRTRLWKGFVLSALILLLAACGEQATPTTWSSDDLESFMADLGQDASTVLGGSSFGLDALTAMPAGSPVGDLTTLALPNLLLGSTDMQVESLQDIGKSLALAGASAPLPNGVWVWSYDEGNWVMVAASDDLELRFPFDNLDGSVSDIRLMVDWDALGPVTSVHSAIGEQTVPTGMTIDMHKDGIHSGELELRVSWLDSSCGYMVLEPATFSMKLMTGHSGSPDKLKAEVNFSDPDGSGKIMLDGMIMAQVGEDSVSVSGETYAEGKVVRTADCLLLAYHPEMGNLSAELSVTLAGETNTGALAFDFSNWQVSDYNEVSLDLDNGVVMVNGVKVATFAGNLNQKDGVIGEDVLVYVGDEVTTLAALLYELGEYINGLL